MHKFIISEHNIDLYTTWWLGQCITVASKLCDPPRDITLKMIFETPSRNLKATIANCNL